MNETINYKEHFINELSMNETTFIKEQATNYKLQHFINKTTLIKEQTKNY